jgi:hypothetical protein
MERGGGYDGIEKGNPMFCLYNTDRLAGLQMQPGNTDRLAHKFNTTTTDKIKLWLVNSIAFSLYTLSRNS